MVKRSVIYFQTKKNQNIISGLRSQEREHLTGRLSRMHLYSTRVRVIEVCLGTHLCVTHVFIPVHPFIYVYLECTLIP